MFRAVLAACFAVGIMGTASADIIYDVQFSSPVYSTTVGGSATVGISLRETIDGASVTNFGTLSGVAFRLNNSNGAVASPIAYTPGTGTSVLNSTPGAGFVDYFIDATPTIAPTVVSSTVRTISLGSFQVTGASAGISTLSVTASPDSYTNTALGGPEDLFINGGVPLGGAGALDFQALPAGTSFASSSATFSAVPEPSSLALLSLTACGLVLRRKRNR